MTPHNHIHPSTIIDPGAVIGKDTRVWHFSHVMPGARIGRDCVLGDYVFIGRNVVIGDGCRIQNHASVFEGVTLEKNVFVGPGVMFTNVKRPRADQRQGYVQTIVKAGATIGAGAVIVCGVTIGEKAMVGAGAVVTRNVRPGATVTGVAAEPITNIDPMWET